MSSYLVLARKYRPRNFDEVIGQEVVTRVLTGALEEGRTGHAYLFAGPRGTGKTTIARVLAKCLNCEQGPTSKPCGECERCVGADRGSEVDIIELDAASHTGVDTIRELRDETAYAPMRARTKVYIIDEVHMLSKGAFNALLKTLEEPPAHVVFLFATTEAHKVPETILSRCQVLRLAALSEAEIERRLEEVFGLEEVKPGAGVTAEIARSARGGMRDALSLSDKLLALAGSEPTLDDLRRLGGEIGARELEALVAHLEAGDRPALLGALVELEGSENELLSGLLDFFRQSLVLAHCGADTPLVTLAGEERERARARAERLGADELELWMQELLRARERLRLFAGQERILLETVLLDLARRESTLPLEELQTRLAALEQRLGGADVTPAAAPARRPAAPAPTSAAPAARAKAAPAAPEPAPREPGRGGEATALSEDVWDGFLAALGKSHGALAELLKQRARIPAARDEVEGRLRVHLAELSDSERKLVQDRRNQIACSRALSRVAGRSLSVELVTARAPAPEAEPGTEPPRRDPFTQEVADLFGGVIEDLR